MVKLGGGSVKGDYFCFCFFYVGGKYIGVSRIVVCQSKAGSSLAFYLNLYWGHITLSR